MNSARWLLPLLAALLLPGCDEPKRAKQMTAKAAPASTRAPAEESQLDEKMAALDELKPEQAKEKLQEVLDLAAGELREVGNAKTARKRVTDVQPQVDKIAQLALKHGQRLNLTPMQGSIDELMKRFENDRRLMTSLKSLRNKLDGFVR